MKSDNKSLILNIGLSRMRSLSLLSLSIAVVSPLVTVSARGFNRPSQYMSSQQSPNPSRDFAMKQVVGIAVYKYRKDFSNIPIKQIEFTITESLKISGILEALTSKARDGQYLSTVPNAYVYLKDSTGNIRNAKVVGDWQYLTFGDQWEKIYPLSELGSILLQRAMLNSKRHAQP